VEVAVTLTFKRWAAALVSVRHSVLALRNNHLKILL
jgi:hypothetical protein